MDYKKAASFWIKKEETSKKLCREALEKEIREFAQSHTFCALATADLEGNVRCTPMEYFLMDDKFWMLTEGGLKFRGLEQNKNVALAIFDTGEGFGDTKGMQISAKAEVIEPWSEEYLALLDHVHIPAEKIKSLPEPLNLLKITPESIDLLLGKLKKEGYSSRQHWEKDCAD